MITMIGMRSRRAAAGGFSPWGAPQDTRRPVLSLSPSSTGAR